MKVTISLNDRVTLKLNAHGAKIYTDYYTPLDINQHVKAGDTVKLELWKMSYIFGEHLYLGCVNPFANIEFEVTHS